eukprot:GHVN01054708.1.p1 GENE.GHVN01054708.1~~GHVN01054708.1.p1  ORF type:complete len:266 (-),score=51.61 GHVN01054708.1:450-1247(-)
MSERENEVNPQKEEKDIFFPQPRLTKRKAAVRAENRMKINIEEPAQREKKVITGKKREPVLQKTKKVELTSEDEDCDEELSSSRKKGLTKKKTLQRVEKPMKSEAKEKVLALDKEEVNKDLSLVKKETKASQKKEIQKMVTVDALSKENTGINKETGRSKDEEKKNTHLLAKKVGIRKPIKELSPIRSKYIGSARQVGISRKAPTKPLSPIRSKHIGPARQIGISRKAPTKPLSPIRSKHIGPARQIGISKRELTEDFSPAKKKK